jgi:hypothetical protein
MKCEYIDPLYELLNRDSIKEHFEAYLSDDGWSSSLPKACLVHPKNKKLFKVSVTSNFAARA